MIGSSCICTDKKSNFKETIIYANETVFRQYEGTVIARCTRCGLLKTIPSKKNKQFNPQQSRNSFYEDNSERFIRLFLPIVEKIKKHKPGGAVLDVGCSSGLLLSLLQKEGYQITGIEPNKSAYQNAKKRFGKNIYRGTLKAFLKQRRRVFDCIIYNHVFEHIEDLTGELKMINKMLKPGGILVVGVPNTDNVIFWLRQKYWEYLVPNEHVWHFNTKYLVKYLGKNGFSFLDKSFNDDDRKDFPLTKRVYFGVLSVMNKLMGTGEAVLLVVKK